MAAGVGEGVAEGVGVGVGDGLGVGEGVGLGVRLGVGVGVGLTVGLGVGEGVGLGVGLGVGEGVGLGVGLGVGEGVGEGVGLGVGEGVGDGVGLGVGLGLGEGVCVGEGLGLGEVLGDGPTGHMAFLHAQGHNAHFTYQSTPCQMLHAAGSIVISAAGRATEMFGAAPAMSGCKGRVWACLAHRHLGLPVRTAAQPKAAAVTLVDTCALPRLPLHALLNLVWCCCSAAFPDKTIICQAHCTMIELGGEARGCLIVDKVLTPHRYLSWAPAVAHA